MIRSFEPFHIIARYFKFIAINVSVQINCLFNQLLQLAAKVRKSNLAFKNIEDDCHCNLFVWPIRKSSELLIELLTYKQSKYCFHEYDPISMVGFSKKWHGDFPFF